MSADCPRVALIGFGEAGSAFADAGHWAAARGYDVLADRRAAMAACGINGADTAAEALIEAEIVLCLVTADAALAAARNGAAHLSEGALWCDMNSVAPGTKREAARAVEAAGGRYVDIAVMSPVYPAQLGTPLLLAGPHAQDALGLLGTLGFTDARSVGEEIGHASTVKMLRSVMYKGMEALTAECLLACEKAGVTDEVLASFGSDWARGADYRLDRMLVHGQRRAAELREVCKTLEDLGMPAQMSTGTAAWQQEIGDLGIAPPERLEAKLAAIAAAPRKEGKA